MNRRGFLGKIGLALAGIAVAPAVNLLSEPETICHPDFIPWALYDNKLFMEKQFYDLMITGQCGHQATKHGIRRIDPLSDEAAKLFNQHLKPIQNIIY